MADQVRQWFHVQIFEDVRYAGQAFHAFRRRQLSYPFSQASIAQMETYFEKCLHELIDVLDEYARNGEHVRLKF